jgi:hypothetical protein
VGAKKRGVGFPTPHTFIYLSIPFSYFFGIGVVSHPHQEKRGNYNSNLIALLKMGFIHFANLLKIFDRGTMIKFNMLTILTSRKLIIQAGR